MSNNNVCLLSPEQETAPGLQLVVRAQRGEEAAFAALYEIFKKRVYSLCLYLARATDEAEDLTQEVFLRLFRIISAFKEDGEFGAALDRLAVELAISVRKNQCVSTLQHVGMAGCGTRLSAQPAAEKPARESPATGSIDRKPRPLKRVKPPLMEQLGIDTGPGFWN